jgi:hypothetical protein
MKSSILIAAVSGIMLGGLAVAPAHAEDSPKKDAPSQGTKKEKAGEGAKHACKGQNACKGQGGCKTDKHACKGHNACKGQGGCKG